MPETKAGPAEAATCRQDAITLKDNYVRVTVDLLASTVAEIDALTTKAGPERSRDEMVRVMVVTGLEFWKLQQGRPIEGGGELDESP